MHVHALSRGPNSPTPVTLLLQHTLLSDRAYCRAIRPMWRGGGHALMLFVFPVPGTHALIFLAFPVPDRQALILRAFRVPGRHARAAPPIKSRIVRRRSLSDMCVTIYFSVGTASCKAFFFVFYLNDACPYFYDRFKTNACCNHSFMSAVLHIPTTRGLGRCAFFLL